jgi:hypothetical protein
MSQHTAGEPEVDAGEVRSAFATLVAAEPELPTGTDDIERRGRRRLVRRRLAGLAVVVVAAGAAGLVAVTVAGTGAGPTSGPVAAPPPAGDSAGPDPGAAAGGAQLAQGFTVDAAVTSLLPALPAGVSVGELPMDIGWRTGGTLDVPLTGPAGNGVLTIRIADGACSASVAPAGLLAAGDLDAVTDAVCAAWAADGSPAIVPAGPPGPEQPDLANQ